MMRNNYGRVGVVYYRGRKIKEHKGAEKPILQIFNEDHRVSFFVVNEFVDELLREH